MDSSLDIMKKLNQKLDYWKRERSRAIFNEHESKVDFCYGAISATNAAIQILKEHMVDKEA